MDGCASISARVRRAGRVGQRIFVLAAASIGRTITPSSAEARVNSESPKYLHEMAEKVAPREYFHPPTVLEHAARLLNIAEEIELLEKHAGSEAEKRYDDAQDHDAEIKALSLKLSSCEKDAERYRWLRDGNGYAPEEAMVRGGAELDRLCDEGIAEDRK
jgi:hypothetical protein